MTIFVTFKIIKVMKKFFSMIIAFVMMITLANAQTVEKSRLFENTYVTLVGGATTTGQFADVPTPFFWDGAKGVTKGVRPFAGLELGKYITPVVGLSVEGLTFFNTTTSNTIVDELAVVGNGKLNFSNWFGGYKGYPRRVEVVGVLGMGWGHDFVGNGQTYTSEPSNELEPVYGLNYTDAGTRTDKNYIVYNAGAELNVNLGKERAWQINVRPGVMWFNKAGGEYQSLPTFKNDARANVQLGVTYKFGKAGKHNFRLCPYSVTRADYDAVLAQLDSLKNRKPETVEVVKTVTETKEVVVRETHFVPRNTVITFHIGSATLSNVEKAKVELFAAGLAQDANVRIVGSADTQTGSEKRNNTLAELRANAVKDVLVNEYGVAADRIVVDTRLDATDNVETSRSAILTLTAE